jgi:FK506-binding nuclear protein
LSAQNYQQTLDFTIGEDERVFFKVTGTHTVYITGNYVIPDDDGHNHHHEVYDSESDSEADSEDSEVDLSPDEDEIELELDDESDELDGLDDPRITEVDSDEEPPKLVKAEEKKAEKKGKNKRTADELEAATSLDDLISKASKPESAEEPKLSKKQLKKLKKNNGEAAAVKPEEQKNGAAKDVTPAKSDKSDKKVQFAKNLEQGPTGSAEKPKPAESAFGNVAKLGVKKVKGVTVDDKKIGGGKVAKKGDKIGMRYIGKLENGKVFDGKLPSVL